MPPSVHKVLIHGGEVIRHAILPIGQLSEEALEARNKDCRRFREIHIRKFSRMDTMEDLFHMLLITSDLLIRSNRHLIKQKTSKLSLKVKQLLWEPLDSEEEEEATDEKDDDGGGVGAIGDFTKSDICVPGGGSDVGDDRVSNADDKVDL